MERRAGVEETAKHASVTETGHRNEVLLNAAHKSQSLYGWTASKGAAIATRSGHRTRAAAAAFQTSSAHKEKKKKKGSLRSETAHVGPQRRAPEPQFIQRFARKTIISGVQLYSESLERRSLH